MSVKDVTPERLRELGYVEVDGPNAGRWIGIGNTSAPPPAPRRPRAPFRKIPLDAGDRVCQLCRVGEGEKVVPRGEPCGPSIRLVGKFRICEDCVTELERVFA